MAGIGHPRAPGARVPTIVMGLSANGLGVLRSLVRLGVEVHGVYSDPAAEIARHSHSLRARYRISDPKSDGEVMATLVGIRQRFSPSERMVLIPTNDTFARFVSTHRAHLEEAFLFRVPPPGIEATFLDKRATVDICLRHAMPIPRSCVPEVLEDVEREVRRFRFPVIIKPALTDDADFPGKNVVVASADELLAFYRSHPDLVPRTMFQELIPSGDGHIVSVSTYSGADGKVLARVSGRKLRQWLPDYGSGCYSVSEMHPALQALATSFLEEIGYVGFAVVEFAEDATTGETFFLELNARLGYRNQLAADSGVDLSAIGYLEMCGQGTPRGLVQLDGVYWIDLHRDIPSSVVRWWRGELSPLAWARGVWQTTSYASFDRRDPKPFLASLTRMLSVATGYSASRQVHSIDTFMRLWRRR